MLTLPKTIEELSNEGCSDSTAMEIATDLLKVEVMRRQFNHEFEELKLNKVLQATKEAKNRELEAFSILNRLSKREKECYLLHKTELLSMGKIANKLNISKSSVQIYIKRAKGKIKSE